MAPDAIADTRRWVERAVIGLNLCPFARRVVRQDRVRYAVTAACEPGEVLEALDSELNLLLERSPLDCDTTLLIAPGAFAEFLEFAAFLPLADRQVRRKGLEGVIQVASFHPGYEFADAARDDAANLSNRSPHPTLQLLREDSVAQALQAFEDPASIYRANAVRLRALGRRGWEALDVGPSL